MEKPRRKLDITKREFLLAAAGAAGATALGIHLLSKNKDEKPDLKNPETKTKPPAQPEAPKVPRIILERKKATIEYPLLNNLQFIEAGYRPTSERIAARNYRNLMPKGLNVIPQKLTFNTPPVIPGRIRGSNLVGTPLEQQHGRLIRSLRFKNISDAVEERYNLPPGIILSMVMQESYGADMNPNALDDGGIGLSHMQPSLAQEFGLETNNGNRRLRDKKHGKELRQIIKENNYDVYRLSAEYDDRFNRLLNLDAVGRMLASHMSTPSANSQAPKDPLERAIWRYAGAYNHSKYMPALTERMHELYDQGLLASVATRFDSQNKSLTMNGVAATRERPPFQLYIETFWEENRKGFDLDVYKKLPAYAPAGSEQVLKTYPQLFAR